MLFQRSLLAPVSAPIAAPCPGPTADDLGRASSFIARHQWLVAKKDYTTLLPDIPSGWTKDDFQKFVEDSRWIFAKTMPQNPHEYALRRNTPLHRTFDQAVRYIREYGAVEMFQERPYKMLYTADTYKYWTMGSPMWDTILINRKALVKDEAAPATSPTLRFLGDREEQLLRSDCWVDADDFQFFAKLIREAGVREKSSSYITIDARVYWIRGLPEKITTINRASVKERKAAD